MVGSGDASRYRVPSGRHRAQHDVRRSRFIATAAHAPTAEAARDLVDLVGREMPDATHHCWAFVAGPPGSTAHVGMSDAGEPHGTAGRPMLDTLLHGGVGEIVVVCTRYFGGVKLGTGPLARAYAESVKRVLLELPTRERVDRIFVGLRASYADVDGLRRLFAESGVTIEEEEYAGDVRYRLGVPAPDLADFKRRVADATSGRADLEER